MRDDDASAIEVSADPLIASFYAARGRRVVKAFADVEQHFSPAEMIAFGRALAGSDHPDRDVLLQRASFAELLSVKRVQPFNRTPFGPEVSFYGDGGPAADKTLVVGFGGMGQRLGLPVANFLQALDASRFDVLMLRDPIQRSYAFGAGSFAPDFASLISAVRERFPSDLYRRVVTIGFSMGARSALRAGFWLGAERAIGIGARLSNDDLMLVRGREVGSALDPFCDCLRHRPHRGLLVHGETCVPDVDAAKKMEANGAGRLVVFARMHEHNLIWRFWTMGELPAFLELLLDGRLPVDRGAAAPPFIVRRTWLPRVRASFKRRVGFPSMRTKH